MTNQEYQLLLQYISMKEEEYLEILNEYKLNVVIIEKAKKDLVDNLNECNDLIDVKKIILDFCDKFHIEFDSDKNKKKEYISDFLQSINDITKNIKDSIEKINLLSIEYNSILSSFSKNSKYIIYPLTNEKLELLKKIIIINFGNDKIFNVIKEMNEKSIYKTNKHKIEAKKKIVKQEIREKISFSKQPLNENNSVLESKASSFDEIILEKAKSILDENKEIISEGYTEDVILAFELVKTMKERDYNVDNDVKVNIQIVLKDIEYLVESINSTQNYSLFVALEQAINTYYEYKKIIAVKELEQEKVKQFDIENNEKLEEIRKVFSNLDNILDEHRKVIMSLDCLFDNEKIKDREKECQALKILESESSKFSIQLYQEYKILEKMKEFYNYYIFTQEYDEKVEIFKDLTNLLEEYQNIILLKEDKKEENTEKKEEIKKEVQINHKNSINNILILPVNGWTGIEEFIFDYDRKHATDYTATDLNSIIDCMRTIDSIDTSLLKPMVKKVKNKNHSSEVHRLKSGRDRLVYTILESKEIGLSLNKPYILVLTAGIKRDKTKHDIYDFADTKIIVSSYQKYVEFLKQTCEKISKSCKTKEESDKKINEFINNLLEYNSNCVNRVLKNIDNYIKNGHKLDDSGKQI